MRPSLLSVWRRMASAREITGPTEEELARDVAILRRVIAEQRKERGDCTDTGPFLLMLGGLPGTGKSYFADQFCQRLPSLVVSSDRMRKSLVGKPQYDREEHIRVFASCHRLLEELLEEGRRVIFDATNLTDGFRQRAYDIAEGMGVPWVIVWCTAPLKVIRRRLAAREAGRTDDYLSDATWEVYCRLQPGTEAVKRPHLTVDSSRDITPQLDGVERLARTGGRP